ncbi:hypothetical protein WCN79_05035 [Xanthomonas axonopodis pv. vasculorum]|nr:hypothetical protein [Xanthomonas axonopodis]QKD87903.1 hypothetical protein XAV_18185 [Xanthomonas axonopodis pv. vasculorum]
MEETRQWRVFLFAACTMDKTGFGADRHRDIGSMQGPLRSGIARGL